MAYSHDDKLVTTLRIANKDMIKILVNIGSSVDILFKSAFEKLGLTVART